MEQKTIKRRLVICIPLFVVASALLIYSLRDADGFQVIWRYFAWANQTLAVFTLWTITVWLAREKKGLTFLITCIPALFMTVVCATYICIAPEGFRLGQQAVLPVSLSALVIVAGWFWLWRRKQQKEK